MPGHFATFVAREPSPGVIIIPQRMLIRVAAEWIVTIWVASEAEEWRNQILIFPR
jgi:hypothetical protein